MSVNAAGTDAGNGGSGGLNPVELVASVDGNTIAFSSLASDLGPTDTNVCWFGDPRNPTQGSCSDIYVRDLAAGTTELVSVDAAGTDSGNATSSSPAISPDGTMVAFTSGATNLVPGAAPGGLYLRSLATDTTRLVVPADTASVQSTPTFSPDGTRLAFVTARSDLGPVDTNGDVDVYVQDLATGANTLVSAAASGDDSGDFGSSGPLFSPDGTQVLFHSTATDLGPADPGVDSDLYLRDLASGQTELVTVSGGGDDGANCFVFDPAFSPDGSKVGFSTCADNLGPQDTHPSHDVYVRDVVADTTTLASVNLAGTDSGAGGSAYMGNFSTDGTKVAFVADAADLVANDGNGARDAFVRDLGADTTTLVSVNAQGTASAGGDSALFGPDPGDQRVAFVSSSGDLGPRDTGTGSDLYLRDLATGAVTLVTTNGSGSDAANAGLTPPILLQDHRIVFASDGGNLGPTDTNGERDVYVATPRSSPAAGG